MRLVGILKRDDIKKICNDISLYFAGTRFMVRHFTQN